MAAFSGTALLTCFAFLTPPGQLLTVGVSVEGLQSAAAITRAQLVCLSKRASQLYEEYFVSVVTEVERRAAIFDRRTWTLQKLTTRDGIFWLIERFQSEIWETRSAKNQVSKEPAADQFDLFCRLANESAPSRRSTSGRILSSHTHWYIGISPALLTFCVWLCF